MVDWSCSHTHHHPCVCVKEEIGKQRPGAALLLALTLRESKSHKGADQEFMAEHVVR